jgi:hypothetical protein
VPLETIEAKRLIKKILGVPFMLVLFNRYQSTLAYFPKLDVTLSIGTNMENDDQEHPSDTLCLLYGAVSV